jgi:hypothetical protein
MMVKNDEMGSLFKKTIVVYFKVLSLYLLVKLRKTI